MSRAARVTAGLRTDRVMSRAARVTAGLHTDRVMSRAACVTAGLRTDRVMSRGRVCDCRPVHRSGGARCVHRRELPAVG